MTSTLPQRFMKWAMSLILFCFCISGIHSQSVSKSIISAGGQYQENSGMHLQWTLGEITIDRKSRNNMVIEEGFHAGISFSLSTNVNNIQNSLLRIYPNPTVDLIYVEGENWWGQLRYTIRSLSGQMVMTGFTNFMAPIDIGEAPPGIYIFHVINARGENYRAKIIKI